MKIADAEPLESDGNDVHQRYTTQSKTCSTAPAVPHHRLRAIYKSEEHIISNADDDSRSDTMSTAPPSHAPSESRESFDDHDVNPEGLWTPTSGDSSELHCDMSAELVWGVKGTRTKLSNLSATALVESKILSFSEMYLLGSDVDVENRGPSDPVTGAVGAALDIAGTILLRASDYPRFFAEVLNSSGNRDDWQEGKMTAANDFFKDGDKGITGMLGAAIKAPMTVTHSVAQGFHNLPGVYGDETLRQQDKITGIQSGISSAGKSFALGLYDGITGLVTQPVNGARQEGWVGGLKGFAKGIGGAAFKPAAGAVGLPGYAFKGIYEEVQKARGLRKGDEEVKARIVEGKDKWYRSSECQRSVALWEGIEALKDAQDEKWPSKQA